MVLHDLNLATRYADHLVAMAKGRLHATGAPEHVLTLDNVRQVFGLESRIVTDPTSGRPFMLPIGRYRMTTPQRRSNATAVAVRRFSAASYRS